MSDEVSEVLASTMTDSVGVPRDPLPDDVRTVQENTDPGVGFEDLSPPDAYIPDRIGSYRILKLVGVGATGRVYMGYDPSLDRRVAIKVLKRQRNGVPLTRVHRKRLQREAKALARVSHANVIRVHEVGIHEDQLFLCMEFMEGATLREWSSANTRLGWREIVEVVAKAGDGLAAAHRAGLVHRDFKPDNVLVGASNEVRVVDFGLARASDSLESDDEKTTSPLDSVSSAALTRSGAVVGTPAYLAPECYHGIRADALADQFAFSVVLWEALFGERPFCGETKLAYLEAALRGKAVVPPGSRRVPAQIRRAIMRGFSPNRDQRWPSMKAMLHELRDDRRARIGRRLGWGTAATVTAMGLVFLSRDPARDCTSQRAQAEVSADWGREQREAIAHNFEATGKSFAKDALRIANARIDRFVGEWVEAETHRCIAAERGAQTLELQALRSACLDDHRASLRAVVQTMTDIDADHVDRAADVVALLGDPLECDGAELLLTDAMLPTGAAGSAEAAALRGQLEGLKARHQAGMYDGLLAKMKELVTHAEASGQVRLQVDAMNELGEFQDELEQSEEAERTFKDAYFLAGSADYAKGGARAAAELMWIYLRRPDGMPKMKEWDRHADVMSRRLADSTKIDVKRLHHLAMAAMEEDKYAQARAVALRALSVGEARWEPNDSRIAALYVLLGAISARLEDKEAARTYFEKGLKLDEAIKGAEHPDVGVSLLNLSIVERTAGRLEKATQHVERALAIFRAVYGDGHPHTLMARDSLASILKLRGDYDGARREYETSLAAWTDLYGPDDPRLAQTLGNLGSLESHVGDHERAAELLARSLKLRQSKSSPRPSAVAIDELNYACAIRELGRLDEALRVLQQAHKRLEPLGSNSQLLWIAKVEIAATKLALGRSDIAREALEELSASPLAAEVSPTNRGAVHFELAKAIMATDRDMARARTLAEHAVEAFTERSMDAEYLEEARTWLAGLPSTSSR